MVCWGGIFISFYSPRYSQQSVFGSVIAHSYWTFQGWYSHSCNSDVREQMFLSLDCFHYCPPTTGYSMCAIGMATSTFHWMESWTGLSPKPHWMQWFLLLSKHAWGFIHSAILRGVRAGRMTCQCSINASLEPLPHYHGQGKTFSLTLRKAAAAPTGLLNFSQFGSLVWVPALPPAPSAHLWDYSLPTSSSPCSRTWVCMLWDMCQGAPGLKYFLEFSTWATHELWGS